MPLTHMYIHSGRSFIGACITDQQNFHVVLELKPAVQAVITNGLRNIVVNCFHLLHDGIEWDLREVLSSLLSSVSSFELHSSIVDRCFDVWCFAKAASSWNRVYSYFHSLWTIKILLLVIFVCQSPCTIKTSRMASSMTQPTGVWAPRLTDEHESLGPIFWRAFRCILLIF